MSARAVHRMRIVFSVGEAVRYISHLDLLRAWERILRRGGVPLAYSQGFSPHPRIVIAMPLPVGCTGEGEVVDVYLDEEVDPDQLLSMLVTVLPQGIEVISTEPVPVSAPALPGLLSSACYCVTLKGIAEPAVAELTAELMARDRVEVTFRRKTYDLRPLVGELAVRPDGDDIVLEATLLRTASGRIGRPDVLVEALGLAAYARHVHRVRIAFEQAVHPG